jgi:thioredoxin-like negative regulator of GroEL
MSQPRIVQARERLAQFPQHDLARFSLAQALYDAGEFREAAEHLRILAERKPDWMVVHILLGKCQLALHDPVAARQTLTHAHALAIAQHHDGPREELQQLLQSLR